MHRLRWRVGTLMVLVVLAALALDVQRRRWLYESLAEYHAREEFGDRATGAAWAQVARSMEASIGDLPSIPELVEERKQDVAERWLLAAEWERRAVYHGQLRRKYEHAAAQPWFPLAPDPPEPHVN